LGSFLKSCVEKSIAYGFENALKPKFVTDPVQDIEREFPEAAEVTAFVSTVAPLLSVAMGLRVQAISDAEFARQAATLKAHIIAVMDHPAHHMGIRRIQEICRANADRLYHWAEDRQIPAENNLAERHRRPTVIARKSASARSRMLGPTPEAS
jgi:transposase